MAKGEIGYRPREPSTKPVEDLWCVYQACLVEEAAEEEEEEDENQKLKKLLMDKFEQGLQLFLSEWSDFHENIPSYIDLKVFTKSRRTCSYSSLELLVCIFKIYFSLSKKKKKV